MDAEVCLIQCSYNHRMCMTESRLFCQKTDFCASFLLGFLFRYVPSDAMECGLWLVIGEKCLQFIWDLCISLWCTGVWIFSYSSLLQFSCRSLSVTGFCNAATVTSARLPLTAWHSISACLIMLHILQSKYVHVSGIWCALVSWSNLQLCCCSCLSWNIHR
jgi:hypothetical protein